MFKVNDKVVFKREAFDHIRGVVITTMGTDIDHPVEVRLENNYDVESFTRDGRYINKSSTVRLFLESSDTDLSNRVKELEARVAELEEEQRDPEELIEARLMFVGGHKVVKKVSRRAKKVGIKNTPYGEALVIDENGNSRVTDITRKSFKFTGMDQEVAVFEEVNHEIK